MAAPHWALAFVFAAATGPYAAFDTSWVWWLGEPPAVFPDPGGNAIRLP